MKFDDFWHFGQQVEQICGVELIRPMIRSQLLLEDSNFDWGGEPLSAGRNSVLEVVGMLMFFEDGQTGISLDEHVGSGFLHIGVDVVEFDALLLAALLNQHLHVGECFSDLVGVHADKSNHVDGFGHKICSINYNSPNGSLLLNCGHLPAPSRLLFSLSCSDDCKMGLCARKGWKDGVFIELPNVGGCWHELVGMNVSSGGEYKGCGGNQFEFVLKMSSDDEARGLFDKLDNNDEEPENSDPEPEPEEPSRKRLKKPKKEKPRKKKRHVDYDDEEESSGAGGVRSFIEEEASEDSDEESEELSSGEFEDPAERKRYEEMYNVKGKRQTEKFMERVEGKDEAQINLLYQQKAFKRRENETMLPGENDDKMFWVSCKVGKEEEMVLSILNKSAHYEKTRNKHYFSNITAVLALKKKYPGKIFIEAPNENDIKLSLEGFIDVNNKKITPLDNDFYANLFEAEETREIQFKDHQYVRVKKGVYEGDLGKIVKMRKSNCDVCLVPRINVQDILMRMREEAAKDIDEKQIIANKDDILKRYTNPRMYYPVHLRPPKKLLPVDVFKDFQDLPYNRKINLTTQGLIVVSLRYDEIAKPEGTMLPIELQPFSKNGNLIDDFQDEEQRKNLVSTIKLEKGEEAELMVGEMTGCHGVVMEVRGNIVVMKCKGKEMAGRIIEDHIDHFSKRFKEGQRVKVVSGTERGKTGLVLKVEGPYAEIWTDNENSIKINKNNLEVYRGEVTAAENLLGLKKDDLIKTTKGTIGIILSTNKDNIKMLDTSNIIQMIGNLDFEAKLNTHNLVAKNRSGDQIKNQTIVRIRKGIHEGARCEVKHVYRDNVFLFNSEFDKTGGLTVEKADNCVVVAKTIENTRRFPKNTGKPGFGAAPVDEEVKVGKTIVIGSGPLKGYRGVIKSVNKDRIEVRVPQKNCTEWIHRDKISQSDSNIDPGKTPRRGGISMTTMYAQSPMNF